MKRIVIDTQNIPRQWDGLVEEIEYVLCEYSNNPLFKTALVTYGRMNGMLKPHLVIIIKFKDDPESVNLSEEVENKLLKLHPLILTFSLFD